MATIGRIPASAPLTSADINDGIITGSDIATTFDLTGKTVTLPAVSSFTVTTVDINGGNIDGTVIGDSSSAAGTFTDLTASGIVSFSGATVSDGGTVTTVDIDGGTIDGATIATSDVTVGAGKTLDVSAGTLTLANDQISGDKIEGGTIGSVTITSADINGGTVDGVTIGGSSAGAITGTTGQFNTSLNVDGTVTADGLTVDGGSVNNDSSAVAGKFNANGNEHIRLEISTDSTIGNQAALDLISNSITSRLFTTGSGGLVTNVNGSNRMAIATNGDISFYEDTGTTPKFFWDASEERLGIGTSSPGYTLEVYSGTGSTPIAHFAGAPETTRGLVIETSVISGRNDAGVIYNATDTSGTHIFETDSVEVMRIDSSGNLLVGTTTTDGGYDESDGGASTVFMGASIGGAANGSAFVSRRAAPLQLNRQANDGDIAVFRKDGTTVGSIGSTLVGGSRRFAIGGNGDSGIVFGGTGVLPAGGITASDNAVDLGSSSYRFDDVYATNGTIQTSDANEKQDIEELSEAERRVAVAAKGLLRKFRWISSVEEKGDDARIHFGIIAQDLQSAFESEGLDAGRYAMFIHSTWTDEETGEERSRMGVRYSELLAFIIAAL